MKTLLARMIGEARLRAETYDEVRADRTSVKGAVATALFASVAAGVGMEHTILPASR